MGRVEFPALQGLSVDIGKGEFVAVVGPSGSGKSTLLNMFGALDRPTKGSVLIDGQDISRLSDDKLAELRSEKIGFVFQTFNLLLYMSALENVEVPMIARGIPSNIRQQRSMALMEAVGLKGLERNRPSEMSGGQQQRVAVARALANDPQIIMADEPTGNLDSKSSMEIIELLSSLNKSKSVTIIMVTHNLLLTRSCDRTLYVKDGLIEKVVQKNEKN